MTRGTVLIVDADHTRLLAASDALCAAGYEALLATNYLALEPLNRLRVDVILLALDLPDIDGVAATRRLHADPATARVPRILLVPSDRLQTVQESLPISATLLTPIDGAGMEAAVSRALEAALEAALPPVC